MNLFLSGATVVYGRSKNSIGIIEMFDSIYRTRR